ncbi:hypothetical protein FPQ18DRAFT_342860 [Pyronema domesticum]|uniref:Uncharacterized protein n=1 Tax=Pyronema omphalodes (strain CBS 100304) TaxID=1076935 RepID=U4LXI6_PYROM|nr:hypothetical protein FPQ18DRAFT_342860 [Pyronema domesticum]CCX34453.1 Similar to hypothetical protein [Tuber melanosporum Mel28]; acc. no. XP_002839673 [Pyronema omphalodes CBS 100304]
MASPTVPTAPSPSPSPAFKYAPDAIIMPALKVGALTGASGLFFGGVIAVARGTPTVALFAAGTGMNCAALGTTFTAVRSTMLRALRDPQRTTDFTPQEKVYISGASGAITGLTAGLVLRGRSNALPGFLVWGLLGLSGQYAYNYADAAHTSNVLASQTAEPQPSLTDKLFRSKWNPIKKLTDVEYEGMLEAKLLAVDAELAITNEQIAELEVEQRKMAEEKREENK